MIRFVALSRFANEKSGGTGSTVISVTFVPMVDFIYDKDCPHVDTARANLRDAFQRASLPFTWTEYRVDDPRLPAYARGFGSPSVLVDTHDVAGAAPGAAPHCRLYEGYQGAPPVSLILAALEAASRLAS